MNQTLRQYYDEIEQTEHLHYQGLAYIITEVQSEIDHIKYSNDITYNSEVICHSDDNLSWYFEMGDGLKKAIMKGEKPLHPLAFLDREDIEKVCIIIQRKYLFPRDMTELLGLFKRILERNENHLIQNEENRNYIKRIAQLLCSVGFNRESHDVSLDDFK